MKRETMQRQNVHDGRVPASMAKVGKQVSLRADEDLALSWCIKPITARGCVAGQDYHVDFFMRILVPLVRRMLPIIQRWPVLVGGGGCETCSAQCNPFGAALPSSGTESQMKASSCGA